MVTQLSKKSEWINTNEIPEEIKNSNTNEKITFDKVISKFENDFWLLSSVDFLKWLKNKLNSKNLKEVNLILSKIHSTNDYDKINSYLDKLNDISSKYNSNKSWLESKTKIWVESEKSDFEFANVVKGWFLWNESLEKIKDINLDWTIESPELFKKKLSSFISVIESDSAFLSLSESEQKAIKSNLKKFGDNLQENQKVSLEFINTRINNLAKQVESFWDEWGVVDFGEWEVKFESKEKAYEFLKDLKQETENAFESTSRKIMEWIWSFALDVVYHWSWNVLAQPYRIMEELAINDIYENFENDESSAEFWLWDWPIAVLAILWTINYTETLYRRIFVDLLARTWVKHSLFPKTVKLKDKDWNYIKDDKGKIKTEKIKKIIRIPDFDVNSDFFGKPENVDLRNEYIQRLNAIEKLKDEIATISDPKHKMIAEKELIRVKSYLNINSNTFWLKAYSLQKDHWIPKRLAISFINWPDSLSTWLHIRDRATQHFIMNDEAKDKLTKGLSYILKDWELKIDDKWKITWAKWEALGNKNYESILNYIESSNLSSEEKKNRIKALDKMIEGIKILPRWKEYIQKEIVNIVDKWYLTSDSVDAKIEKYINDKYPFLEQKWKIWWLSFWENIENIKLFIKEHYWKKWPAVLTSWDSMLFKFQKLHSMWLWEWNQADLDEVFRKIENWKIELRQIYAWQKFKIISDTFLGFVDRFWFNTPEYSKLKKFWEWFSKNDIKKIIEEWENVTKSIDEAKDIFKKEWEVYENIKHMFDLDSAKFPSEDWSIYWKGWKEVYFEKMLDKLVKKSEKDGFKMTTEKVKLELVKMYEWYLSIDKTLSELSRANIDKGIIKSDNYKSFIEKIETGKWIWTLEDLNKAIVKIKKWDKIPKQKIKLDTEKVINRINKDGAKLWETHFNNEKYWLNFDSDWKLKLNEFSSNDLKLAELSHKLNWTQVWDWLWDFIQDINKGVSYTSIEFFDGLNDSLNNTILVDKNTTLSSYRKVISDTIIVELNKWLINYEFKTFNEKKIIIDDLKSKLWVSTNDLKSPYTEALKNAWSNINLVLEKISDFEKEKENLKIEETEKNKSKELKKENEIQSNKNKVKELDNKLDFLKNYSYPTNKNEYKDSISDLQKRWIKLNENIILDLTWKANYSLVVERKIQEKILDLEKLKYDLEIDRAKLELKSENFDYSKVTDSGINSYSDLISKGKWLWLEAKKILINEIKFNR